MPTIERQECISSRENVKHFYSFHFGNEMVFSPSNLKARERFLTKQFASWLATRTGAGDPFTTGTEDLPKAFRIGECKVRSTDRTSLQVLLFWKDDARTEQREIFVEAVKEEDYWLVDKVIN
jgi:hypothetical protein